MADNRDQYIAGSSTHRLHTHGFTLRPIEVVGTARELLIIHIRAAGEVKSYIMSRFSDCMKTAPPLGTEK